MAILNNNPLVGASGNQGGYNINNSLRFRGSASAYLSRTPSSAGNRKTWTWSAWIKLGTISVNMGTLFIAQGQTAIYLNDGTNSSFRVNGAAGSDLITSLMPRDPSAWYHLVVACDTTQATDTNRLKIYVNGVQQTAFQAGSAYPTLNGDTFVNSTAAHYIGRRVWNGDQQYDGYIAEQYLIDGSQKAASDFGETDTTTGVWKPKAYTGTYGTNGFYLKFSDIATTSGSNAGLGKDFSGNGNYWTTNNISVTAGTTYDAMTDSPTNTSATVANYAVLNPLWKGSVLTLAGANLNVTSSGLTGSALSTIAMESGKYYCEVRLNSSTDATIIGIAISSFNPTTSNLSGAGGVGYYVSNGDKFVNGTQTAYGASCASGDIVGIALDVDAGTITFYKNNTSQGAITHGLTGPFYFATSDVSSGSNIDQSWNFGQRPFSYTPPTGYLALNTFNLPNPTILQGNKYMDATLYTQNGAASNVIVNAGQFKPDLVWIKNRDTAGTWNNLVDSVRGGSKTLYSNATNAEGTDNFINTFNSNGFTLNIGDSGTNNTAGRTQVAWNWQAGQGSTSSNTSGTITSTVSVNTTAGFSIVTWTGNGTIGATVGHGLGVAPSMIIVKQRNGTEAWPVYHISTGATKYTDLSNTAATATSITRWNNTAPSSTVITLYNDAATNGSSSTYVAYCFAAISGFSRFGSYTGNGSTDGPFVATNFAPKFVLIKSSSDAGTDWWLMDSARSPYNIRQNLLSPNTSSAENASVPFIDFLSNGFKIRTATAGWNNNNGSTYIYMAFAENTMKYSLGR